MEAMKISSFKSLAPNAISMSCATAGYSSFSRVRRSFSLSACSAATSFPTIAADSESVSLGHRLRKDFPILHQILNGKKLVYLDNAATSQKPAVVLDASRNYYDLYNSNVHRGIHSLSLKATDEYELARKKVARFINASDSTEIVFTKNATEAINLVAYSWFPSNLKPGDEHLLFLLKRLLSGHTIVGAKVLVDACQSVPHMVVDVQKLNADFLVASSHKMCGPTGVGFLYGKSDLLCSMPPFLGGGEMIQEVFLDHSTYAEPPSRFEAGTPAIGEAIALGAAIDYLSGIGMQKIHEYEVQLGNYLYEKMYSLPGVRIYGPKPSESVHRAALCSFNVEGLHPTALANYLDEFHRVAIRSGHHCAQPLHRELGVNASARASLYFYNTKEEVDFFIFALEDAVSYFNERK